MKFSREQRVVDTDAFSLALNAKAFLRAAETLHDSDPRGWGWAACYVNLGFALELALKAYVRDKGGDEGLQLKLGHDLAALYREAVWRGFQASDSLQAKLVEDVSPTFKDMSVRYGTCGWVALPAIEAAVLVTGGLVEDVWRQGCFVPTLRNSSAALDVAENPTLHGRETLP